MMQSPWDRAQPDEWLPRSLRLCWGGDGSGGGDGGGGFGGDSGGFGGANTGGGDWGSSGSYDAGGFNAGGDIGAWAGTAYDASTAGQPAGGGGDWGSFGATNYGGMNAPNPTFDDIAGPNPGVTTGGGDWGSAGAFSAAGTGGGPLGSMFGAAQGAGAGLWGGDYGGGGPFGDYGGGGTYGGGGGGGKGGGGPAFSGTSRSSVTDSTPGYVGTASGGKDVTSAAPSYGGGVGKGGASDETGSEPQSEASDEGPTPAAEVAPDESEPLGSPQASEEAAPEVSESRPSETSQETSQEAASVEPSSAARTEAEASHPSAFGPQTVNEGLQALSNITQTALDPGPADYQGSPYADMGPQGAESSGRAPDSFDSRFGDWGQQPTSQAYQDVSQQLSNLTQTALDPNQAYDYQGSPYANLAPQDVGKWSDLPGIYSTGISNLFSNLTTAPAWAQNAPTLSEAMQPGGPLSAVGKAYDFLSNLNVSTPAWLTASPTTWPGRALSQVEADQIFGEQGRAGQLQDTFDSRFAVDPNTDTTNWGAVFEGAAPETGINPGAEQYGVTTGIEPGAEQYGTEAYAPGGIEPGAEQYGVETGINPGAEQTGIVAAAPTIESFISGNVEEDPSGRVDAFIPGDRDATDFNYGSTAAPAETSAQSAAAAAQQAGASPEAAGAAAAAAYAAAARGASPAEQAEAAANAAQQAGASQQQAMAIASGVYNGQAQEGGGRPQSQGTTLSQVQDAVYGTGGPYITSGGNVYGGHTVADIQAAVYGDTPPGMPTGNPNAPLSDDTSQQSYADTAGRAQSFIPGGAVTNWEYAGSPQAAPPSLVEQAQQGQPGGFISGDRGPTDFNYPSSTSTGINPGAEQYGFPDDDAPEPEGDRGQPPQDPNAPRPPGNIPGQPIGARSDYRNSQLDNPRTNSNYRDSGRTDYPQGRPGITFRTARQAGIEPRFRADDINVHDVDARLVERINRAMEDMPANLRDGLVATSGWRPAHRGEAHEHGMDQRTSQESVYSRYNPNGRNVGPAARPGNSNHGPGRAIDFRPGPALTWLRDNAGRYGLETLGYRNGKIYDEPHIQLSGARGAAGARPSAQEQAAQRAIDAQNRQAAIDRGLIAPGRGQAPNQRADVPTPQARPRDAPQPEVARPPAEIPPAPTVLPPEPPAPPPAPIDRPLADVPPPAPFLTPPARGPVDPVMMARTIAAIQKEALRGINPDTTKEQAMAQGARGRAALIAAGVPPAMARAAMLDTGAKTAVLMGYGPGGKNSTVFGIGIPQSVIQGKIAEGVGEAMQGYQPAAPGPVQGPYGFQPDAPEAPGKRSEFGEFQQFARELTRPPPDPNAPPPDPNAPAPPIRGGRIMQAEAPPFGGWPGVTLAAGGRDVGKPPAVGQNFPGRDYGEGEIIGNSDLITDDRGVGPAPPAPPPGLQNPNPDPLNTPFQITPPFSPDMPGGPYTGKQASLLDILQNFNPISTAEARGRGRGDSYPVPPGSTRSNPHFTFYGPGPGGKMEGGFETSRPNQAGTNVPITLDMVRSAREQGRDLNVTLASDPSRYGETINVGTVTFVSPIDGKQYTLDNVRGFVHDTGSAFKGRPEKVDIAVSDYTGWSERAAGDQTALAHVGRAPNAIVVTGPGETGASAVGAMPPAAPPPPGAQFFMPREGDTAGSFPQGFFGEKSASGTPYPGTIYMEMARQTEQAQSNQAIQQLLQFNPEALANFIANQRASTNIDDRRGEIQPDIYGPEPDSPEIAWPAPDPSSPLAQALGYDAIRGLAKGGHVAEDEPVVVGEEGPEYFVPDQPGTVVPHMPQPASQPGRNIDRWPKLPAVNYPGQYGGVEREMMRQTRAAQDPMPSLMDMIDTGRLPLNEANWRRMISDPDLIALGRSRMEDRINGGPEPEPAVDEPPDIANQMAQALGYGSIARRPIRIGRQSYDNRR